MTTSEVVPLGDSASRLVTEEGGYRVHGSCWATEVVDSEELAWHLALRQILEDAGVLA